MSMSMSMSNSIFTTLLISHVMPFKFIPRLGFTCDQCVKCLWDHRSTFNMFIMSYGTTLVFMTWTHLASNHGYSVGFQFQVVCLTKVEL